MVLYRKVCSCSSDGWVVLIVLLDQRLEIVQSKFIVIVEADLA